MNKKYYIILGLSYLGFIGSWYISFLLASTLASSTLDYVLAFIITTVMQAVSFYFFTKKQMGIEILLFSISILGTICYQYNIHSNILNESWNKSEAYNIALENRETKKNNIANTNKIFDTGINALETQIKALENSKMENSKNKHIGAWQRGENEKQYNKQINDLTSKLTNLVASTTSTLRMESDALQSISLDRDSNKTQLQSRGYLGISQAISDFTGVKETLIVLIIQILIAVTFEITAIKLHLSAQSEKVTEIKTNKPKLKTVANTTSLNDSKLVRYKKAMRESAKDGICIGYKKIGEMAGLTASESRNIYEHLKATKCIESTNKGTKILKGA